MSVLVNEIIIISVQQAGYHLVKPPRVSPVDGAIERDGRAVSKVEGRSECVQNLRNGGMADVQANGTDVSLHADICTSRSACDPQRGDKQKSYRGSLGRARATLRPHDLRAA